MKYIFLRKTHERNYIMRKILKDISRGEEPDLESDISRECMFECVNRKFVTGVHADRSATNDCFIDISEKPFVTYDGIQFLENKHPGWQITFNTILGVISLVFSALSLILAFLSNFFDIGAALQQLF